MLEEQFDQVIVYPCGPRQDKPTTNDVDTVFRATMIDLCFADLPKVEVCLDDLELDKFTRTHELQALLLTFNSHKLPVNK